MASSDQQGSCHLKFKSNSPCFLIQDFEFESSLKILSSRVSSRASFQSFQVESSSAILELDSALLHPYPALLRVPSGEVWRVELTKSDGKIWLENGWHQFSNHYTLDFGPWIQIAIAVTFSVMSSLPRCGHSGCYCEYNGYIERQLYLYFADAIAVADYYLKPDADNTNQLCQETLMKKLCSSTLSDSSGKTWTATLKQRQREKARFGDKLDGELLHRITLSNERKAPSCASPSCPETLTDLHKAKALQIASAFKSENPFFVMVLHPSHVNSNRLVSFELKPAAGHFHVLIKYTSEFCKAISVKDAQIGHTSLSNGKSWPVICYKYSSDGPKLNGTEASMNITFIRSRLISTQISAHLWAKPKKRQHKAIKLYQRMMQSKIPTGWTD
ncbi:hypothetical protein F3Y22_tig00110160pilonHSYRG00178 [Hibiscus syriacus]|uniref:Uncharacterized protein n=1 Tax=Hibiscus syriacus TaxID=106335 RepID=A0A6A3BI57_HIBSY|nr:hypothetical protein F3Y22_tig00110160pilonHSYRG00178 [Hibiscus syriacus]